MSEQQDRQKTGSVAWFGVMGDMGLVLMKGIFALFTGSIALIADALSTALPVTRFIAMRNRTYIDQKGITRSAVIVTVMLFVIGIEVVWHAMLKMYQGVHEPSMWYPYALMVVVIAMITKEVIRQYRSRKHQRLSAQGLPARWWAFRLDTVVSFVTIIGMSGSMLGVYYGYPLLYYLDPVAAIMISLFILKMGYQTVKEFMPNRLDQPLYEEDAKTLQDAVGRVKGVIAVEGLQAHGYKQGLVIEVKISVDPSITVHEGQEIAKIIKHYLLTHFTNIVDVNVQVSPFELGYPYKSTIEKDLNDFPTIVH